MRSEFPLWAWQIGLRVISFFVCNFLLAGMSERGGAEVNLSMFIGADRFSEI